MSLASLSRLLYGIREGVKAVNEGRIRPADEVFEELARDELRAENARLQELVRAMELAHSLVRDEAEDENARLQARVEEAEAQVAIMAAGYDHAADEVRFDKHQRGFEAALQLYQERIHQVRQKVRLSKAAKDLLSKARERDGYKALAERCMEASQALLDALGQPRVASGLRHGRSEVMLRIGNLHAAINAAPEEAREKERR
ncbi:hypothetical protein LCGC14_0896530 [marine sediment metagenome]|uniref:Uncharacterized protein n=1 Tax=marine sediment metagenome TaxID=412755 RepID=A0A0F9NXU1_9ZZZZ